MKIIFILLVLVVVSAVAQKTIETKGTTTYQISKHTISSGGGVISGGGYKVITSIGQIDAGHNSSGGIYEYSGGFLAGTSTNNINIFKDGFE